MDKITYGDLNLNELHELGVEFAHYTPRRGRSKQLHDPKKLPKRFWKDGEVKDSPSTYFFITDNNGLEIAPTAAMEVEYPITVAVRFTDEAMAEAVTDELYAQGLEIESTLPLSGDVVINGDGTWTVSSGELTDEELEYMKEDVIATEKMFQEVVSPKVPKTKRVQGTRKLVTKAMVDEMFGITFGDLIQVYDMKTGEPIEQYILVMGFNCCPRLKNVRTEKDIDLYFLTDHPYEVISSVAAL